VNSAVIRRDRHATWGHLCVAMIMAPVLAAGQSKKVAPELENYPGTRPVDVIVLGNGIGHAGDRHSDFGRELASAKGCRGARRQPFCSFSRSPVLPLSRLLP